MRKSEFRGWTNVFRFTLTQTWKNRSFLIFMIITWVISLLAIPTMKAFTSKGKEKKEYDIDKVVIEKVYVLDEFQFTAMGFNAEVFKEKEIFKDIPVVQVYGKEYEDLAKEVNEEPKSIIIHICPGMTGVSFDIVRAIESDVTEKECDYIGQLLADEFNVFKYEASGMGEEQLKALEVQYDVVGLLEEKDGTFVEERAHISSAKYWVVYGLIFIIMMIAITGSTQVATAVATDKSSKVMEYLLTSVRPLALVFGKVLAQVVSVVLQLGITFFLAFVSNRVTALVTGENYLKMKLPEGIFENITPVNVMIALLAVAFGVMLYGFIAGLCGSLVSKLEELQESLSVLTISTMIGAYLAMFAAMSMQKSLTSPLFYAAVFVPLSSPFFLPGICLVGVGSIWIKLAAVAILLVLDVIVLIASARVYEMLILYNGTKLKFKDIFKFLKQAKGGKAA